MPNPKITPSPKLCALLGELYRPSEIEKWLVSPQSMHNGERPCDMIASGREPELIAALRQFLDGNYA